MHSRIEQRESPKGINLEKEEYLEEISTRHQRRIKWPR